MCMLAESLELMPELKNQQQIIYTVVETEEEVNIQTQIITITLLVLVQLIFV